MEIILQKNFHYYTRKYWTLERNGRKWVGKRMYVPTIEEVRNGCSKE